MATVVSDDIRQSMTTYNEIRSIAVSVHGNTPVIFGTQYLTNDDIFDYKIKNIVFIYFIYYTIHIFDSIFTLNYKDYNKNAQSKVKI